MSARGDTKDAVQVTLPVQIASRLPSHKPRPGQGRPRVTDLTAREVQALALMAEGLSNKQIADRIGTSDHSAKFHVANAMRKLGAGSRTEAVILALRKGILAL